MSCRVRERLGRDGRRLARTAANGLGVAQRGRAREAGSCWSVGCRKGWRSSVLRTDLFDEAVTDGSHRCSTRTPRALSVSTSTSRSSTRPAAPSGNRDARRRRSRAPVRECEFRRDRFQFDARPLRPRAEITVAVGELARVLRPGGHLVLTLDNPANPVVALGKALPRRGLTAPGAPSGKAARASVSRRTTWARRSTRGRCVRPCAAGLEPTEETTLVHAPRVVAVIVAEALESRSPRAQSVFLALLAACERLGSTPIGRFTAHTNALLAVKPALR